MLNRDGENGPKILSPVVAATEPPASWSKPWLQAWVESIATTSGEPPAFFTSITVKPSFGNTSDAATAENVRVNVAYLKTAKPIIADLVASGKLDGGVYDIATGKVTMV